jgi:hypothetical protein
MHPFDVQVAAIAARQLNLITRADVERCHGTDHHIAQRVNAGVWQSLAAGVYLLGAAPPTWVQRQLAACFAAGPAALASHRAGSYIWDLDGSNEGPIELTVPYGQCPVPDGTILHRTQRVHAIDRRRRKLIPVTSVTRTLFDLGAVVPKILVERALEDALRRGLTDEAHLVQQFPRLGGRGCRGAGVLRAVLLEEADGKPARTGFEVVLLDVIRRHGLPLPVKRYPARDRTGRIVAELDLAYPDRMIGLEADGEKWHVGRSKRTRTYERRNMLTNLGWQIFGFTWDMVVGTPEAAARTIADALAVEL